MDLRGARPGGQSGRRDAGARSRRTRRPDRPPARPRCKHDRRDPGRPEGGWRLRPARSGTSRRVALAHRGGLSGGRRADQRPESIAGAGARPGPEGAGGRGDPERRSGGHPRQDRLAGRSRLSSLHVRLDRPAERRSAEPPECPALHQGVCGEPPSVRRRSADTPLIVQRRRRGHGHFRGAPERRDAVSDRHPRGRSRRSSRPSAPGRRHRLPLDAHCVPAPDRSAGGGDSVSVSATRRPRRGGGPPRGRRVRQEAYPRPLSVRERLWADGVDRHAAALRRPGDPKRAGLGAARTARRGHRGPAARPPGRARSDLRRDRHPQPPCRPRLLAQARSDAGVLSCRPRGRGQTDLSHRGHRTPARRRRHRVRREKRCPGQDPGIPDRAGGDRGHAGAAS